MENMESVCLKLMVQSKCCVEENTYKIVLPEDYSVSSTSNVSNLYPYLEDEADSDSRTSLFQPGEHDTGVNEGN